MKQLGSAITGTLKADNALERSTGTEVLIPGCENLPSACSDRLMASHPKETDRALEASLPQPVISCLGVVVDRYTNSRGEFIVESRNGARKRCDDPMAASKALVAYESACLPAPDQTISTELASLKALTKSAKAETDDIKLQLGVYARQLRAYPGDVVVHVLRTHANMETFWPSWAELKERLDLYANKRLKKRQQLRELLVLSQDQSRSTAMASLLSGD